MSDFYDDLETLDPGMREAALFAALPRQIANAKANAPYFSELLADVDPGSVTDRAALARSVLVAGDARDAGQDLLTGRRRIADL